jgi:hypothetical protein
MSILEIASSFLVDWSGLENGAEYPYRYGFDHQRWSVAMLETDHESVQLSNAWTTDFQRSPALVAHALGSYAAPNALSGFRHSLAQGASLFEVDVYLDSQNILRCHHGPDIPKPIRSGECELGSLLKLVPEHRFLILDIKTDFVRTADRVIGLLAGPL